MTKLVRVDENTFVTCDADEPVAWITMGGKRVPIMEGGKLGDNPVGATTYKPKSAYGKAIQEAKGYDKKAKEEKEKAKKAYDKASKNEEKRFNALKNQNEKEYKESDDRGRELNGKAYMHSTNANTQEQLAKTTRSYAKTVRAQKLGEGTKGKVLKESESQKLLKESAQEAKQAKEKRTELDQLTKKLDKSRKNLHKIETELNNEKSLTKEQYEKLDTERINAYKEMRKLSKEHIAKAKEIKELEKSSEKKYKKHIEEKQKEMTSSKSKISDEGKKKVKDLADFVDIEKGTEWLESHDNDTRLYDRQLRKMIIGLENGTKFKLGDYIFTKLSATEYAIYDTFNKETMTCSKEDFADNILEYSTNGDTVELM